jgi:NTE family protein
MANPALFPLFDESITADILLVQINPLERWQTPVTAHDIRNRLNEISFNGTLLRELRAVAFVTQLIEEGKLSPDDTRPPICTESTPVACSTITRPSRSKAEWDYFVQLRDAGRQTAQAWLADNYGSIGVRGTFDLQGTRM